MIKYFKTPNTFKWIFHRRVWGFSSSNKVYLTFDDGPTSDLTPWILDFLDSQSIKATFFCVGANVKKHPDLLSTIIDKGHAVGNHTMRHEKGTEVSEQDYLKSIEEANTLIPSNLFRPPYGRLPMSYSKSIRAKYKIIMWSWLSYDYDSNVPIELILKKAQKIKGGDVLVVHDNIKSQERLKDLLPELVAIIKSKGLEFDIISA
ncbi:MAG: peptidoglycan/xylan/chitin deacetylase (PgdA/CDA1 family) [Crocinitomicaceae bacterium]|jgi:peptidoglycan/xylan/chitin deacetylase (PgdA/CDA1 family)